MDASPRQKLPPVTLLAVVSMVLVVTGGTYLAAFIPKPVGLALPIALLAASALVLVLNVVLLSRLRKFAWDKFFLVGGWSLLAYIVIAGMLEYVFVLDQTPRDVLVLLTLMLVIYAVDIPLLFAFSVARYQPVQAADSSPSS